MVRVVNENTRQSKQYKDLMLLLTLSIEEKPSSFLALLARFNMMVKDKADKKEIRDKVLYLFSKKNVRFNEELSELLGRYVKSQTNEENYGGEDTFDLSSIGGIADKLIGKIGGTKLAKEEGKKEAVGKILEMKSQQEKNVQEEKKRKSKQQVLMAIGIITGVVLLGAVVVISMNGSKQEIATV